MGTRVVFSKSNSCHHVADQGGADAEARRGALTIGGESYPALRQDLPTIVEAFKTYDQTNLVKCGDIGQVPPPILSETFAPLLSPHMHLGTRSQLAMFHEKGQCRHVSDELVKGILSHSDTKFFDHTASQSCSSLVITSTLRMVEVPSQDFVQKFACM